MGTTLYKVNYPPRTKAEIILKLIAKVQPSPLHPGPHFQPTLQHIGSYKNSSRNNGLNFTSTYLLSPYLRLGGTGPGSSARCILQNHLRLPHWKINSSWSIDNDVGKPTFLNPILPGLFLSFWAWGGGGLHKVPPHRSRKLLKLCDETWQVCSTSSA